MVDYKSVANSEKHSVQKKFFASGIKNIHHFREILCPATLPHLGHFFDLESILLLSHNYKKQDYMITLFFIHSVLKIY